VREGAKVVICGRKQETLDPVAREIGPDVKASGLSRRQAGTDSANFSISPRVSLDASIFWSHNAATNVAQGPAIEMEARASSTRWWRLI